MNVTHEEIRKAIATNIRRWRTDRGMTQKQLADAVGVDQSNISSFERGIAAPSINTLADLANVLEIPPDLLLRAEELCETNVA